MIGASMIDAAREPASAGIERIGIQEISLCGRHREIEEGEY
jgi:hypothetical protein